MVHESIWRRTGDKQLEKFPYPFCSLPTIPCHIAPVFAIINACLKCASLDLDAVAVDYYGLEVTLERAELRRQLGLLREIWELFEGAKPLAKSWEHALTVNRSKTKRYVDVNVKISSRSSL